MYIMCPICLFSSCNTGKSCNYLCIRFGLLVDFSFNSQSIVFYADVFSFDVLPCSVE